MDMDSIRLLVAQGKYVGTTHFYERLDERTISLDQVKEAVGNGFIIEERPREKPHPKCTLQGSVDKDFGAGFRFRVPLYIALALGEGVIFLTADWNPPRSLGQKSRRRR
ncbi:MAG: DUF4258 domain-containing protein [Armatimonadetes bacterium]|nr:DUF4258 domain-containing protein [Armatimonadota bacterium]